MVIHRPGGARLRCRAGLLSRLPRRPRGRPGRRGAHRRHPFGQAGELALQRGQV